MTQQEILAERTALGEMYASGKPLDHIGVPAKAFEAGFDAAIELMLKRETRLRNALAWYAKLNTYVRTPPSSNAGMAARAVLDEVPEWESEE